MHRPLIPALIAALCATAVAQTGDAPPVNTDQLLQALRQFRDQSATSLKTRRANALQQVMAAASSNEKAAATWADAVLAVQFAGVDHQGAAVREWKQADGEALRSKEGATAARLHLHWLAITIQHAAGAETKQLLNSVIEFTRQVESDAATMGRVAEQIEKARERAAGGRNAPVNKAAADEARARKLHDSIMKMAVTDGPVARRLEIPELLGDAAKKTKKGEKSEAPEWELVPGNLDGIYNSIILPELRAARDPRLLDYWDMLLKREAEAIHPGMPDFEERRVMQVRRPALLWARAQDLMILGQRNRAVTEMFNLIKTYPQHPEAAHWMAHLESILAPPAANQPSAANTQPGIGGAVVAPPVSTPPATSPGPPNGATPDARPNSR